MSFFPEGFEKMLAAAVGDREAATVLEALQEPPSVSLRLNPAKLEHCPFPDAEPVPWSPCGYLLKERPVFTLDPLFHTGCYYVQDSSAMFVGHVFRQILPQLAPGSAVLDLCAAPGGKSTDLAASLRTCFGDKFSLLCNEVIHSRFTILRDILDSWGDPRTGCVSMDPAGFGDEALFDVIVADVPCSGEGMFRKDAQARAEWSAGTVDFCAARSRRILRDIWPVLKPGGYLVFSTCTFNAQENDENAIWAASFLGADILPPLRFPPVSSTRCGNILLPGFVPGEGQWVATLRKHGERSPGRAADVLNLYRARRPSASEAEGVRVEVDRLTALHYLHGDAVVLPPQTPVGPVTLCFQGQPLGPGKNLGKRCNNHYPKAKRIKMDIP